MAYASASDVAALTRQLVAGACDFSTSTSPTLAQVNAWLSSGCAIINATIAGKGYGTIPTSSAAYDLAAQVNALYGAWKAEASRSNARQAPGARTRAEQFKLDFDSELKMLVGLDLSRMGVSHTSKVYAGGISISDKDSVESNSDRVAPRFARGMFRNSDSLSPRGSSAS